MKQLEYNIETAQDNTFDICCALEQCFNIKSLNDEPVSAYDIESTLNYLLHDRGFILVKVVL